METSELVLGIAVTLAGYFIGAIPFGIVVARLVGGPDPRTVGSGRTGGANTMRAVGAGPAAVAGILDFIKGSVAVLLARALGAGTVFEILAGLLSVLGHSRSIYIGFAGGRGVAPAFGSLLVIQPLVAVAILPVFFGIVAATRYTSLASLTASVVAGLAVAGLVLLGHMTPIHLVYAVGGAGMIWLFHLDNIHRLVTGTERKISFRR